MPASKLSAMSDEDLEAMLDEGPDEGGPAGEGGEPGPGEPGEAVRAVSVDMPGWMVDELDAVARHLAVTRQAVVNMWLAERLAEEGRR